MSFACLARHTAAAHAGCYGLGFASHFLERVTHWNSVASGLLADEMYLNFVSVEEVTGD